MTRRRVVLLPVGNAGTASTRYRLLAHLPALSAAGFDTEIRYPLTAGRSAGWRPLWRLLDLLRDRTMRRAPGDLLFVQRKTYPPVFAAGLRRRESPIVFDVDDALYLPPPNGRPGPRGRRRYRRNFEATAAVAELVLAGNRELAAELPHERFELLPTAVDAERFQPGSIAAPAAPSAGWVGHSDNLPYLERLGEPLREIGRRHPGFRLIVVADREPRIPGVELEFRRWSLASELSCFDGMGIGLMPLDDTPWARGKCAFKAIQYMALGIPAVVSPVGANRELVRHAENGFLAAHDAGWVEALDELLSSPELAGRIAAAGRSTVLERYSLDVVSHRLVQLLTDLAVTGH